MYKFLKVVGSAAAFVTMASAASATTVYAESVSADGETCSVASLSTDRKDLCNALGAEDLGGVAVDGRPGDGGFTAAANFTELLFDFGTKFTGPIYIWEVTGNQSSTLVESITYTLTNSVSGNSVTGSIVNQDGTDAGRNRFVIEEKVAGLFDSLLIQDTTGSGDGFDIDAIAVAAVPLPASAALMLVGLGAFGVARRKSAKS
jgi:hypothetical protein